MVSYIEKFKQQKPVKKSYIHKCNQIKKQVENYKLSKPDKLRIIPKKDKEFVWNNSEKHPNFDHSIFRIDIIGNIVIKGICYNTNPYNRCFVVEYEHFISHSKGGKTSKSNTCILNAGINKSKGDKPLYEHNFEEYNGLKYYYGVSPGDLLEELEYNLHNTCKKYNLLFKKKRGFWTLVKNHNKDGYKFYNDEYLNFPVNIKVNNKEEMVIVGVAVVGAFKCLNDGVDHVYKNHLKPCITDSKEETTFLDKAITFTTSIIITGLGILIAVSLATPNKSEKK
jgi:hypothetical protein